MENKSALEELLAAIGDNASQSSMPSASFTSAVGGVPTPVHSYPINSVAPTAQHGAGSVSPASFNFVSRGVPMPVKSYPVNPFAAGPQHGAAPVLPASFPSAKGGVLTRWQSFPMNLSASRAPHGVSLMSPSSFAASASGAVPKPMQSHPLNLATHRPPHGTGPMPPPSFISASGRPPMHMPSHSMNPTGVTGHYGAVPSTPRLTGNNKCHLDELVNFLGGEGPSSFRPSLQMPADQSHGFAARNFPVMPGQQKSTPQSRFTKPRSASYDHLLPSGQHQRDPVVSLPVYDRTASPLNMAAARPISGLAPTDITAELIAATNNTGSSRGFRNAAEPVTIVGRLSHSSLGVHPVAVSPPTRRQITEEQILVGHFCRYAIITLTKAMQDNPQKEQAEKRLKEHIKRTWAQWVRGMIQRRKVFESVTNFVLNICPNATETEFIQAFKIWYEREFQLQEARSVVTDTNDRQNPSLQLAPRHQTQASQVNQQYTMGQQVRTASFQAHVAADKVDYSPHGTVAGRNMTGTQLAGREPDLVNRQFAEAEKQFLPVCPTGDESTSIVNNSVQDQSMSCPPSASVRRVGMKVPNASGATKAPVAVAGGLSAVGSKGVLGNKGLMTNTLLPEPKQKAVETGSTKNAAKMPSSKRSLTAVSLQSIEDSAKGLIAQQTASASATSCGNPGPFNSITVQERPSDTTGAPPLVNQKKKAKNSGKRRKRGAVRKNNVSVASTKQTGRKVKPPTSTVDMEEGRTSSAAATGSGTAGAATSNAQNGTSKAKRGRKRKFKNSAGDISLVNDIVDIENEVDALGRDAGGDAREVLESEACTADMLLDASTLSMKMEKIAKRSGINTISQDAMESVSLVVRERLMNCFESLMEIAAVRTEAGKALWNTDTCEASVIDKLERMRADEERSLTIASELRVRREKEWKVRERKRLAREKSDDDSSSDAGLELKRTIALEKMQKEDNIQRDTLSGMLDGIQKKRKKSKDTAKGLAGLASLPPITMPGGSYNNESGLAPVPRPSLGTGIDNLGRTAKNLDLADKLKTLKTIAPLVKQSGTARSSTPASIGAKEMPTPQKKFCFTLKDCLFLMESEQNMRKSSLIYKWYARLDASRPAVKKGRVGRGILCPM